MALPEKGVGAYSLMPGRGTQSSVSLRERGIACYCYVGMGIPVFCTVSTDSIVGMALVPLGNDVLTLHRTLQTPPLWGKGREPCYCQMRVGVQVIRDPHKHLGRGGWLSASRNKRLVPCLAFSDTILIRMLGCLVTALQR